MESTPPPLPNTPPTPPAPAAPRKGWWSRNWKWFVPTGCFTLIILGVIFSVCVFFLALSVIKSSDAYKTAFARAKNDPRVTAALGSPIRDGLLPSGTTKVENDVGETNIVIPISGPKGKAKIQAIGTKSGGNWEFSTLTVQVEGGDTIDLSESPQAKVKPGAHSTSDEEEEAQTEDERVEAITLAHEKNGKLEPVKNFNQADNPEHIVVVVADGAEGTHVRTAWTNLNAGGATNQKLWEKELVTDESNRRADFSLSNRNSKSFPPGDYKIDVYLDDELVQTVRYKVQ